ncbi:hypothetical protein N9C96_01580 [bacterium]|nr:hypothetical protein [bacterium]
MTLRRIETNHRYHGHLHDYINAIEHALTALILIRLGAVLPLLLAALTWPQIGIALALILVMRPLTGWLALQNSGLKGRDRWIVAIYGVRGIGSLYYLAYATGQHTF